MIDKSSFQICCDFATSEYSLKKYYQINLIISMVADGVIAIAILILNVLVLYTITKHPSLHTPSNYLILLTAAFDVLIGVCSMPVRIAYLCFILHEYMTCFLFATKIVVNHTLGLMSFIMVTIITVDRCVAIFYPYYYHRAILPKKRRYFSISAVVFIIVTGINCCFVTIGKLQLLIYFEAVLMIICLVGSVLAYGKIKYLTITIMQRSRSQSISSVDSIRSELKSKREKKGNLQAFIIIFSLVLCYFPYVIISIIPVIYPQYESDVLEVFKVWSFTIACAKSMINPLIYCFSISSIRKRILKKWATRNNAALRESTPSVAVIFNEKAKPAAEINNNRDAVVYLNES